MTSDDVLQLQQPLTAGGIRSVNFFNGRLLTSKDLTREQEARREADARLGLALGEGVAKGLEVKQHLGTELPTGTYVHVNAGVAINRVGQVLRLPQETVVALTQEFTSDLVDTCLFSRCIKLRGGTHFAGAGVYVLTLAPAAASEGRAPTNGLDPTNVRCNTDTNVEALQFRLLKLTEKMLSGLDFGSNTLRNELAYRCFGADIQSDWFASLLTASERRDDLLDGLREIALSDQEVPLALVYFAGATNLGFIDMWAVRQLVHVASSSAKAQMAEPARSLKGLAMYLQFQQHISDLAQPTHLPSGVTAQSYFSWLPPAGIIPVREEIDASNSVATTFFAGLRYRPPVHVCAAQVEALLRTSMLLPPINTSSGEAIWLYRVRENRVAIELGTLPSPTGYLVFASGHLDYQGNAHYDLSRFDYANYALTP